MPSWMWEEDRNKKQLEAKLLQEEVVSRVVHDICEKSGDMRVEKELQYRIPKEPIVTKYDLFGTPTPRFLCPSCGDDWNCNEFYPEYCWDCGQRLDWSCLDTTDRETLLKIADECDNCDIGHGIVEGKRNCDREYCPYLQKKYMQS